VAKRLGAKRKVKRAVAPNVISLPRGQDGTEPDLLYYGSFSIYLEVDSI
jgi:hypothetical protein